MSRITKVAAACVLAASIGLGGCAQQLAELKQAYTYATTTVVTPQVALVAINTFAALEATAKNYLSYCLANKNVPAACGAANRRIVIKSIRSGHGAVLTLEANEAAGTPLASTVYNVLVSAITALQTQPITVGTGQ